ncbi:aldo/keto reductase [Priestia endophytica]|uniref:aldo/keto reductase n=1 Tax=Priestia endophytica TaxID=135735 RepID=UPI00227F2E80|nr:aldo/keto reductase [Priestia endophytica]MCY8233298.1 aldo/keto reductase [Priestia endophytica]
MMKNLQDTVTLYNGVKMPGFGLGVFKVEEGKELVEAVKNAIKHGYRSIDTAAIYGNEEGVGVGVKEALEENNLRREDLFITSKVWNDGLSYEETISAYEESLKKLGLDYLDLYLIHWPGKDQYKESWRALETLYKEGKVKAIGVSNFEVHHLEGLLKQAEIKPMINQVEYHPRLTQSEVKAFCEENEIRFEAWSPLMQGELLQNEELTHIAKHHGKSVAQIILRWDVQNGVITIPKSTKEHRIIENANIFDFQLTKEEMQQISSLNENRRVGPNPNEFNF